MFTNDIIQPTTVFIKKQIRDLTNGDIVLHSIYRSDGLMLIKQYKDLSNDLALKIKYQINKDLPVIVLSPDHTIETFNENKYYNDKDLIMELQSVSKEYSKYMKVPLEEDALIDKKANPKANIDPIRQTNYNEDYIGFLSRSPFFSTFENKLESSHLKNRAQKVKENLITTILDNKVLLDKLNEIKDYKDILLLHSINTTSFVLMIGLTLELPETTLLELALANLLIDISVTQIPKTQFELHLKNEIPNKDFYNLHLNELKKSSAKLPLIRKESIIYGILDHYEYYNGKGHPKGKKGSDISLFGRIIPIAQAYDEMVGGYFYNDGIHPLQAFQKIWEKRGVKFDPTIIRIFIDRTTILKEGQSIMLSDLSQGTIVGFTDFINYPFYPIVKLHDGNIVNLLDIVKSKTR
ncbi:MAG: hypothetical protein JJT76_12565 [Clostridiaceae bacterium]|nr:hypothetical protein [Clostridiaceae bacterium]